MSAQLRARLSFANVTSLVALFVALGGGAYAIGLKKNSVKSKHIADGQVTSADVADNGLTGSDVLESSLTLPPGPQGAAGPQGPPGTPGTPGTPGADGSPDTAAQVLAKLLTVDTDTSGLNADTLDGVNGSGFVGTGTNHGGDVTGAFSNLQLANGSVDAPTLLASGDFSIDPPSLTPGQCTVVTDVPGPALTADDMTLAFVSGGNGALDLRPARPDPNIDAVQATLCNTDDAAVDSGSLTIEYVVIDR